MKRFMFVLALLLVVGLSSALAQSEAVLLPTAEVATELLIEPNTDGSFGLLAPGRTYVVTPGGFKEPPGPGEAAGDVVETPSFIVTGDPSAEVVVSLVLPGALISDDGYAGIPLSNWSYAWNYDGAPDATFVSSGPISGNSVPMTIGGDGTAGLLFGTTISVPTTAFAGTYTAQIIGTVAYAQ